MGATQQQIKVAYEDNKMSPAEIAEDLSLDEAAVKAALMNCSSKYRKDCGVEALSNVEDGLNFTDEELRRVNQVIFETAVSAEHMDGSPDYKTRLAAATYIRDDKKGRKEAVKHMANNTFNILQLNEALGKAREVANGFKQKLIEA